MELANTWKVLGCVAELGGGRYALCSSQQKVNCVLEDPETQNEVSELLK